MRYLHTFLYICCVNERPCSAMVLISHRPQVGHPRALAAFERSASQAADRAKAKAKVKNKLTIRSGSEVEVKVEVELEDGDHRGQAGKENRAPGAAGYTMASASASSGSDAKAVKANTKESSSCFEYITVELELLSEDDSRALVAFIQPHLDCDTVDSVVEAAEGHPLFLYELALQPPRTSSASGSRQNLALVDGIANGEGVTEKQQKSSVPQPPGRLPSEVSLVARSVSSSLSTMERSVKETQHLTEAIAESGGELVSTSTKSTKAIRRFVQTKMGNLTPFQAEVMMYASCLGSQITAEEMAIVVRNHRRCDATSESATTSALREILSEVRDAFALLVDVRLMKVKLSSPSSLFSSSSSSSSSSSQRAGTTGSTSFGGGVVVGEEVRGEAASAAATTSAAEKSSTMSVDENGRRESLYSSSSFSRIVYQFAHQLMRDAVYSSLTAAQRETMHATIAVGMEDELRIFQKRQRAAPTSSSSKIFKKTGGGDGGGTYETAPRSLSVPSSPDFENLLQGAGGEGGDASSSVEDASAAPVSGSGYRIASSSSALSASISLPSSSSSPGKRIRSSRYQLAAQWRRAGQMDKAWRHYRAAAEVAFAVGAFPDALMLLRWAIDCASSAAVASTTTTTTTTSTAADVVQSRRTSSSTFEIPWHGQLTHHVYAFTRLFFIFYPPVRRSIHFYYITSVD